MSRLAFPKPHHKVPEGKFRNLDERKIRKTLLKDADDEFSLYIRERDFNICRMRGELCRCSGPIQCNHKISRANNRLRWDERNAVAGCAAHNQWAHYNPVEWAEYWKKKWPEDVQYLELARHGKGNLSAAGLGLIVRMYRDKRAAMKK